MSCLEWVYWIFSWGGVDRVRVKGLDWVHQRYWIFLHEPFFIKYLMKLKITCAAFSPLFNKFHVSTINFEWRPYNFILFPSISPCDISKGPKKGSNWHQLRKNITQFNKIYSILNNNHILYYIDWPFLSPPQILRDIRQGLMQQGRRGMSTFTWFIKRKS